MKPMHHKKKAVTVWLKQREHAVRHLYDCGLSRELGIQGRQQHGQPAGLRCDPSGSLNLASCSSWCRRVICLLSNSPGRVSTSAPLRISSISRPEGTSFQLLPSDMSQAFTMQCQACPRVQKCRRPCMYSRAGACCSHKSSFAGLLIKAMFSLQCA